MIEFIAWLFLTLVLFLIVFIFIKILETASRMQREGEIEKRMRFISNQIKDLEEITKQRRSKK